MGDNPAINPEDNVKKVKTEADPSQWDEQRAVTGRPNDEPEDNSTFASRTQVDLSAGKAPRDAGGDAEPPIVDDTEAKQVDGDEAEDKAVKKAASKTTKAAKKS